MTDKSNSKDQERIVEMKMSDYMSLQRQLGYLSGIISGGVCASKNIKEMHHWRNAAMEALKQEKPND